MRRRIAESGQLLAAQSATTNFTAVSQIRTTPYFQPIQYPSNAVATNPIAAQCARGFKHIQTLIPDRAEVACP